MKTIKYIVVLFLLVLKANAFAKVEDSNPNEVVAELINEIKAVNYRYELLVDIKQEELSEINKSLLVAYSTEQKVDLLVKKDLIKTEIKELLDQSSVEISKIRYLKGLQIIKILYEKVLGLDHHFASVRTLNEINKISNPNQYPEYEKLKELLASKKDKKTGFDLTSVLGTNTIVSVVQTFSNMFSSSLTKEEKEKELANVDCILDFTLRMQNDLNTIYFETAFLQTSNDKIKSLGEASNNIIEAVKYVTDIVNQLWVERNKRRELEDEITRLKQQVANVSAPSKPAPLVLNNKPLKKEELEAESKLASVRINYHRTLGANNSLQLSLNQYLAGKGNPQKSEQLTRLGLLNSDQVYILFHEFWKDSKGKLIQKDKFQDILRDVFHTANTTHRTPCLKSDVVRDNMAIVCQVFCKKKPNPRDNSGNILEVDNPAYTASPAPCVRFQVRYTSKAIDYLRANWYKLLNGSAQPVTA